MNVQEKLQTLRNKMLEKKIDAYIIPSSDPHNSEYVADHWQERSWISGFNGSAGTVVVTQDKAGLWTDFRYFIQAESQLQGSGIELFKKGISNTPTINEWLSTNLDSNSCIAFNGMNLSISVAQDFLDYLNTKNFKITTDVDLITPIWKDRTPIPKEKVFILEKQYTGTTIETKLEEIREKIKKNNCEGYLINSLDEICWTLNIRGNDIPYNPCVISFLYIDLHNATFFVDRDKINQDISQKFKECNIDILDYYDVEKFIKNIKINDIHIDRNNMNYKLFKAIPQNVKIHLNKSLISMMKSCKNKVEVEGFRKCHINDGVAITKFIYWLINNVNKQKISEIDVINKLLELRSEQPDFVQESFGTISAYKEHGASAHYNPYNEKEITFLNSESFFLFDSGGQYKTGTTDITRTVHLGTPQKQEKIDYTLVLKGLIQLSMVKFPYGTKGCQLDTLARYNMWQHNIDYGHGTGHGVGHFLNVHEGPQSISPALLNVAIEEGMVTSNEPGIYRPGKYGIRLENLIISHKEFKGEFGEFLNFETITIAPFDPSSIMVDMLSEAEKTWLNNYHQDVFKKLSPWLSEAEKTWLSDITKPV